MIYDPSHPVDKIFNKVEDISKNFSAAAQADFTKQQSINIAYTILISTGKYQQYTRE